MARIAISLNEVLRDYIGQLTYVYSKYVGPIDIKEGDVTNFNLIEFFKFPTKRELNKFLYEIASLEIHGHADQLHDGIFLKLNNFLSQMKDEEEHQIILVSREVEKSIPATLFFLSKVACKATDIRFVQDAADKWNGIDVLITANPIALENKPEGKTSIKINASYNSQVKADFQLDSIEEFLTNEELRNSILNTKTITYE
jgi:hypothetical protein